MFLIFHIIFSTGVINYIIREVPSVVNAIKRSARNHIG
ncbi:hypothetical protein AR1Y2_1963 [Anaerostipes rhamnosivorans]|uniref:Uncharacterized protein n=1 Tax=Anaerostipes rhamnosivorans TaxID=1229621 RepID=A0A4P8IFF5_9FIRM|nr:hypothetical protein AR1Y2_1963 [Anaerostipes rhamnosivorans]